METSRSKLEVAAHAGFVCSSFLGSFHSVPHTRHASRRSWHPRSNQVAHASISLPAWEREYEQERGLVGTSYETATVEEVTSVGDGFLRIAVDTAVTCTSQQYLSEGQFLFLKPWGDEDGSIEPCCFTAPPGGETVMEFYVPEESAVGAAALAGEMLEVSEVMGDGFAPHLSSKEFADKTAVVAACAEQFCAPVLLALRNEARPVTVFVVAEEEGPFSGSCKEWVDAGHGNRRVQFCADESTLLQRFEEALRQESSVAVLLSGDANLCQRTETVFNSLGAGRQLSVFAP